jgi:hypothetical protein
MRPVTYLSIPPQQTASSHAGSDTSMPSRGHGWANCRLIIPGASRRPGKPGPVPELTPGQVRNLSEALDIVEYVFEIAELSGSLRR